MFRKLLNESSLNRLKLKLETVLILAGFVFLCLGSIAQEADSLRLKLKSSPRDTSKVFMYRDLAFALVYTHPDSAVHYNLKAVELSRELKFKSGEALCTYSLGNAYDYSGNSDSAIFTLQKAIQLFENVGNIEYIGNAYNAIGISYYYQGDLAKALEYYEKAELHFQEHGFLMRRASVLNNIGILFRNNHKYDKAIQTYHKSLKVKEQLQDSAGLSTSHYNLGVAYSYIDELDSAIIHLNKSLETRPGVSDSLAIAETNAALAQVLYNMGKIDESEPYFNQAWSFYKFHQSRPDYAALTGYYAKFLIAKADYKKAYEIVSLGLENLQEVASPNNRKALLEIKSETLAKLKRFQEAYEIQTMVMSLTDSLKNSEQQQLVEEMEAKYEAREKQGLIDLQQIEIDKSTKEKNYLIIVAVLFVLLLIAAAAIAVQRKKRLKTSNEKNRIITESLAEKEILLREIHHRVKNNLQVISSLLSIQSREIQDEKALEAVNESRNRVKSMAIIHQNLYQEDNLTGINASEYITKLCQSLFQSYRVDNDRIQFKMEVEPILLDVDSSIPIGLILNELISNALKHAFPNQTNGIIQLSLKEVEGRLIIKVQDNGVGMSEQLDKKSSFGMKMIEAFARKLDAEMKLYAENGFAVELYIKNYKKLK